MRCQGCEGYWSGSTSEKWFTKNYMILIERCAKCGHVSMEELRRYPILEETFWEES